MVIWNLSEKYNFSLGSLAPWILGGTIGSKPHFDQIINYNMWVR